ncbi:hypothetical protein D1AOALGA4SA_4681 [Olavius algarvensis Delta 1 endosymbiont]|nr:hypothetical protein D1AOALGA4SA_4681 [Olavius algarvensis Delta 1 endosymbiont]
MLRAIIHYYGNVFQQYFSPLSRKGRREVHFFAFVRPRFSVASQRQLDEN